MNNKDNAITLSKNKDTTLMPGVNIKTADNDTLRFYVYKKITEPGDYQIRGAVAGTFRNGIPNLEADDSFTWNTQNFAGFFYDIKNDLGKEELKLTLTGDVNNPNVPKNKLSGDAPRGAIYTTTAQKKAFERKLWGSYNVIGFMAEKYFAGYNLGVSEEDGSNIFYAQSTDKNSLSDEQLEKILIDNKDEMTVTSGTPLKLQAGYELAIKAIDIDGNKVYVELSKDGQVVDSKVVSPSRQGADERDKTYYYKNPSVGTQNKLVTVGVHFKNAFRGTDQNLATIDGIWQISDTATEVKADTQYDKMTISTVDAIAGTIIMNNKDNAITLSKNKDTTFMPGVNIKIADNDTLRFYIYKPVTIEGAAAPVAAVAPANVSAEAAPAAVAAPAAGVAPAAEAAKNVTEAAKTNVTEAAKPPVAKPQPGFEGIFALAGLLAVTYLVLGRRE
jgi:S-layer protein (TIGR01567 family)